MSLASSAAEGVGPCSPREYPWWTWLGTGVALTGMTRMRMEPGGVKDEGSLIGAGPISGRVVSSRRSRSWHARVLTSGILAVTKWAWWRAEVLRSVVRKFVAGECEPSVSAELGAAPSRPPWCIGANSATDGEKVGSTSGQRRAAGYDEACDTDFRSDSEVCGCSALRVFDVYDG